jgi:uncharacterized protein (DUF885 family)
MGTAFSVSDEFTERWADLDPLSATTYGIVGRDHLPSDFSPAGHAARADLYRRTRKELAVFLDDDDAQQSRAATVTIGWLDQRISEFESEWWTHDLNHTASPYQDIRDVFDVMPRQSAGGWESIMARLNSFGQMLDGYRESLELGVSSDRTVAVRQAEAVLAQAEASASDESRFLSFPADAAAVGVDERKVRDAVDRALRANGEFAAWLRSEYLPSARPDDAVGRDEYLRGAEKFLGIPIAPEETYQWGWSEVRRIRAEMRDAASTIMPGKTVGEVIEHLDNDPNRSAATREDFVRFVSDIQQEAISQLAGEHFDVPEELRTVTVNIAPPGGSLGAWYMSPSEDFKRPGSIWYAPGSRVRLPYWGEVSTAYHEGFPGHHLQVGTAVLNRDRLSRFHRTAIWYAGSGEGWALYAERLMDELGFFENQEYRLGLLASQLFRSIRVVLDIGCQLGLALPDDAPMHAGEVWNYDIGVDYMTHIGLQPRDMAESEVTRYLGWWGQAISYKVGEREILKIRDEVQARDGADFDRKGFHRDLLDMGAVRLDHLREALV